MVSKSNFRTDNYSVLKTITACLLTSAVKKLKCGFLLGE